MKDQLTTTIKISRFRRILPQVLATAVKSSLLLSLGLASAFPTVIISALTGLNTQNNPNETISLSAVEASWLGSISHLFKLVGSICSGWIIAPLGYKKAMFFLNLPQIAAWLMLCFSTTVSEVFVATSLFGLSIGLMETPIITYISEVSEASVRGILASTAGVSSTLGLLIVLFVGNLTDWRSVAFICLTVPIITTIAVFFIPNTPIWLLSKQRDREAIKALQFLRGWVPEKTIQNEFDALKSYQEYSNACVKCEKAHVKCPHPPPTVMEKLENLFRKRSLKVFCIMLSCSVIAQFCGLMHLMPYMVQIFYSYQIPICPNWATVYLGLTGVFGTITCCVVVKFVGKRKIYLTALALAFLTNLALASYGFYKLPTEIELKSFEHKRMRPLDASILPLALFIVLRFCTSGIVLIPLMMLSELFPFKIRGIASGFTSAIGFIIAFVASKSFYNIEDWLNLPAAMMIYASIAFVGLIITYKILPETEKCTLEDIEKHFSDNKKGLTNRKIARRKLAPPIPNDFNNDKKKSTSEGYTNKVFVTEEYFRALAITK